MLDIWVPPPKGCRKHGFSQAAITRKKFEGNSISPVEHSKPLVEGDNHEEVAESGERGNGSDDQYDEIENDLSEAPPLKIVPDPGSPTQDEVDDHYKLHIPFRAWCPCCIQGKAKEDPHIYKTKVSKPHTKPTFCMDYKSFGQAGENDDAKCETLIAKDCKSKNLYSHVVEEKGKGDG